MREYRIDRTETDAIFIVERSFEGEDMIVIMDTRKDGTGEYTPSGLGLAFPADLLPDIRSALLGLEIGDRRPNKHG